MDKAVCACSGCGKEAPLDNILLDDLYVCNDCIGKEKAVDMNKVFEQDYKETMAGVCHSCLREDAICTCDDVLTPGDLPAPKRSMDTEKLKAFALLDAECKEISKCLNKLKAEKDTLSEELVEEFVDNGLQSVKTKTHTIYLQSRKWAKSKHPEAVARLQEAQLDDCVMVGTQRLSAVIRELGEAEFFRQYPELEEVIHVEEHVSVRARKA